MTHTCPLCGRPDPDQRVAASLVWVIEMLYADKLAAAVR